MPSPQSHSTQQPDSQPDSQTQQTQPRPSQSKPEDLPPLPQSPSEASTFESTHVHAIYSSIAPHFSETRHKPWPLISSFLLSRRPGSVGLDVGCGNGKYLAVNPDVLVLGSDMSAALLELAQGSSAPFGRTADVLQASILDLPHESARFDFAICVAVVHHLSMRERRVEAVREILRCVRSDGEVLVYVWALEQGASRRGWDVGCEQDVMVPWVRKGGGVFRRFYHLYCKGELEEDVCAAGGEVRRNGWERDNWWVVARVRREDEREG